MLSTRAKLTMAFVAGLVVVTFTLFLSLMTARNAAVFRDIAQYAAAQGDLAERVITHAAQTGEPLLASNPSSTMPALTSAISDRLDAVPGYIIVVDTLGRSRYRSREVMRRRDEDMATLQDQLGVLPRSGEALSFQLDSPGEKVLLVSRSIVGQPGAVSSIASGGVATRAATIP